MTQRETLSILSKAVASIQAGQSLSKELWLDATKEPNSYVLGALRSVFCADSLHFTDKVNICHPARFKSSAGRTVVPSIILAHGRI